MAITMQIKISFSATKVCTNIITGTQKLHANDIKIMVKYLDTMVIILCFVYTLISNIKVN